MEGATTALTTAFGTMITDATSVVTELLPVVLGLVGLYFVINKGVSFFKKMANKA